MYTVNAAYQELRQSLFPALGERESRAAARAIFQDLFQLERPELDDRPFPQSSAEELRSLAQRVLAGEPVQYVTGFAWFYGMKLVVSPVVLIPRPETEEVVQTAKENLVGWKPLRILDVGTGSGCLAIALAREIPGATVVACDVSEAALRIARRNAGLQQVKVDFRLLDFLDESAWPELGVFDAVVSNPPYIAPSEAKNLDRNVRDFEPETALYAPEGDSLAFYRALARFGKKQLSSRLQGIYSMFIESSSITGQEALALFRRAGYRCSLRRDLSQRDRIIVAGR